MKVVDFFEKTKILLLEAFSFKRYKAMSSKALMVLTFIFMLPFFLGFLFGAVWLFLLSVGYTLVKSPVRSLHSIVREEGEVVKGATQVIVYFFAWPLLVFVYAFICILTFFLYLTYFFTVFCAYVWTLAGIRFHISPDEDVVAIDNQGEVMNSPRPLAFVLISAFAWLLSIIFYAVGSAPKSSGWSSTPNNPRLALVGEVMFVLWVLFAVIYVIIGFRKITKLTK